MENNIYDSNVNNVIGVQKYFFALSITSILNNSSLLYVTSSFGYSRLRI